MERDGPAEREIGAVLYLRIMDAQRSRLMQQLVVRSGGIVAGVELHFYDVMNPETARFSSTRKITPAALERVEREYASGLVEVVNFYDRNIPASVPSDEPLVILSIGKPIYDRIQDVSITIPMCLYNQGAAVAYLRGLVSEFGADYGCTCSGSSDYVLSVLSWTSIHKPGVWVLEPDDPEYDLEQELFFYQGQRKSLREKIPRACWGNILSPAHVEGLGGEDCIRNECGCYLVERWGENLYLQLTESPWNVSKERLLALNRYFEPIRFPGAPEPVYLEEH